MRIQKLALIVFAALVLTSACSKDPGGIIGPDPGCTTNCNPGGGFETVPTDRHYLKDSNGENTWMWMRLVGEPKPMRGSTIITNPSCNPVSCPNGYLQNLMVEVGVEKIPNPATFVNFKIGLGNGMSISQQLQSISNRGNGAWSTDPSMMATFTTVPESLVITGSFEGSVNGPFGSFPSQSGAYAIPLGYKQ